MDDYEMEGIVKRDIYKVICKVKHIISNQLYAMRIYDRIQMGLDDLLVTRRELEVFLQLEHPNIANIYDYYLEDDLFYVVGDLLEGDSLFQYVTDNGPYQEIEAKVLILQLLHAIEYIHAKGIIHRNLKPEGIIIDNSKIKISNFGMATQGASKPTSVCGSPHYMAPEIIANRNVVEKVPYGKEVDIWSLGVIVYVLLSGTLPFDSADNSTLFQFISLGKFSMSGSSWHLISDGAKNFISKMIRVDPRERSSASELLLDPWLLNSTLSKTSTPPSEGKLITSKLKAAAMTVRATIALKNYFCQSSKSKIQPLHSPNVDVPSKALTMNEYTTRYDLKEEIPTSCRFGISMRAIEKSNGAEYNLQFYQKSLMTFEDEIDLNSMVDIQRTFSHPNIIRFKELFTDKDEYCLVTECTKNGDLFDRVVAKQFYDEHEAKIVLKQILNALVYCHHLGVIHRNVKLESIMLPTLNDDLHVKLSNFSMAVYKDPNLTQICGSHDYIAPEVVANLHKQSPYGFEVDIWSLGVVAFSLLCGYLPFHGNSEDELFQCIADGDYEFHDAYWSDISDEAKDFISVMLKTCPKNRATAQELLTHPWLEIDSRVQTRTSNTEARRKLKKSIKSVQTALAFKKLISFESKYVVQNQEEGICRSKQTQKDFSFVIHAGDKLKGNTLRYLYENAAFMKTLHHPNIKCLYDIFSVDGKVTIVEDLVRGGELFDRIIMKSCYSECEVKDLLRVLLDVIDFCHARGVSHSNLKPENICLASSHDDLSIKLMHFGRTKEDAKTSIEFTAPEVLGNGMSVKYIGNREFFDSSADIWSIGVLTYVMLCGYVPFHGHSHFDLFKNIKRGRFYFDSPYWDSISIEAKTFLSRTLTRNPNERPTAKELLLDPWLTELNEINPGLNSTLNELKVFKAKRKLKSIFNVVKATLKFDKNIGTTIA